MPQSPDNINKNLKENSLSSQESTSLSFGMSAVNAPSYSTNENKSKSENPLTLTNQIDSTQASFSAPTFNPVSQMNSEEDVSEKEMNSSTQESSNDSDTSEIQGPIQVVAETEEKEELDQELDTELQTDQPPSEDQIEETQELGEKEVSDKEDVKDQREGEQSQENNEVQESISKEVQKTTGASNTGGNSNTPVKTDQQQVSQNSPQTTNSSPSNTPIKGNSKSNVNAIKGNTDQVNSNFYVISEDQVANYDPSSIVSKTPDGSYIISSSSPIEVNESVKPLDQSKVDTLIQNRKTENTAKLEQFLSKNESKIMQVQAASSKQSNTINASISSARSLVMAAEQAALGKIESDIQQAIASTETSFSSAEASILSDFASTQSNIESAALSAIEGLSTALVAGKAKVQTMQTTVIDASNTKFDETAADVVTKATTMGTDAVRIANDQAVIEDAKPIAEMSRSARFFEGGDYEKNKHNARVNACKAVGEGFQKSFSEKAAEAAQAFIQAKSQVAGELTAKMAELNTALETEHTQRLQEVEAAKNAANQSASMIMESQIQVLTAQKDTHLQGLETVRSSKIAEVTSSSSQIRVSIESAGAALKAKVQGIITSGIAGLHTVNDKVSAEAQEIEKADPIQFQEFLNTGHQTFSKETQAFLDLVNSSTQEGCSSLSGSAKDGESTIQGMSTAASDAIQTSQSAFETSITTILGQASQQFSELSSGLSSQMTELVSTTNSTLTEIVDATQTQFLAAVTGIGGKLGEKVTELIGGFQSELDGIQTKMSEEADKAEAAVSPRWKSVLKFVINVIITIAVIVAVGVLMAVTGGGILAILGAIAIGVAGGMLKQLANNAIDGQPLMHDMGKAAAFGALDGLTAIIGGGVGTAIASKLATKVGTSAVAKFAVSYVSSTVVEATVDSIGSGIKEMVNRGEFSLGAFVDGFKKDFVFNLMMNAAANGIMEIPAVKNAVANATTAFANRTKPNVSGPDISTNNADVPTTTTKPDVDTPSNTIKPDVEPAVTPNPDVEVKPVVEPKPEVEVKPEAEVKPVVEPKPEVEVKPEAEVKPVVEPKPEVEVKPEAEVKPIVEPKPEAEVKPESEVKSESEITTKPDVDEKLSASAQTASDLGLPKAPDGYFYNTSKDGTLFIQRKSNFDADGNLVPKLEIDGDRLKWPEVDTYLSPEQIKAHMDQFQDGAGYFVPKDALDTYGRDLVGRPDGQFVMTKAEMERVIKEAGGDIKKLEELLGIPPGLWQGKEIVRIDVEGSALGGSNARMASGNEGGANELWIPGGKTSGGVSEAVVDQLPIGSYAESPAFSKDPSTSSVQVPKTRLPRTKGNWDGSPGESSWNSTIPEVLSITKGVGIPFTNGRIDLSQWSKMDLEIKGMTGTDNDFSLVYKRLMEDFGFKTQKDAKDWLKANNLSPHHSENNIIQLVPTILNKIPHIGGAYDLRTNTTN